MAARIARSLVAPGPTWASSVEFDTVAPSALLRDVFRPFAPDAPRVLELPPDAAPLAQAAYDERTLPSGMLDAVRLAILADALEEAGSTTSDILLHLRSPGPHVRGCWALDLVLGKS
jgi:hypothetical protein